MAKVTFNVPDDLLQSFKEVLLDQRKKISPVLRDAISAYVRSARSGRAVPVDGAAAGVSPSSRQVIAGFKNATLGKIKPNDETGSDDPTYEDLED